ncbi:MAG: hypothetical protein Q8R86_12120 [Sulfuricurvum sp.]|nr:hypothetical protein [Sulfuricurvum sp.]
MKRTTLSIAFLSLVTLISGCANREGVAPSQNTSLQAVSPSTTSVSEGGAIQRGLDSWLKEEWAPLTTTPSQKEGKATQAAVVTTPIVTEEENTSFGLQKYADKWKKYHENKEKLNEGKPKEASNIEALEHLPVIGK